jgi:hypothetical protein
MSRLFTSWRSDRTDHTRRFTSRTGSRSPTQSWRRSSDASVNLTPNSMALLVSSEGEPSDSGAARCFPLPLTDISTPEMMAGEMMVIATWYTFSFKVLVEMPFGEKVLLHSLPRRNKDVQYGNRCGVVTMTVESKCNQDKKKSNKLGTNVLEPEPEKAVVAAHCDSGGLRSTSNLPESMLLVLSLAKDQPWLCRHKRHRAD